MQRIIFILVTLAVFFAPGFAKADGGIIPPPDYWVYETGQKAVIFYQNKTETLVLSTSFTGNAKDFAYIVPTPTKPEVTKISDDIFTNLEQLTLMEATGGRYPMPMSANFDTAAEKQAVTVLEEKKVGLFEIKILSAEDANALYQWLKDNNFKYPESKKYILDDYIQNKWFFTTAKISAEAITPDVESKLRQSELSPLRFVFSSENIVYPLKISAVVDESKIPDNIVYSATDTAQSVSAGSSSEESKEIAATSSIYPNKNTLITLYIFADHKKELPDFSAIYANWISLKDIEKLAKDDNGNSWVKPKGKMYLTKMTRYLSTEDMTKDLFPDNAKNNDKVGVPSWWEQNVYLILFIESILFIMFFVLTYWQFTPQKKITHVISWILQIISFVLVGLPLILIFAYLLTTMNWYYTYMIPIFLIVLIIPIIMIVLMISERGVQKHFGKS